MLRHISVFRETPHETVLSNLPVSPLVLYRDGHGGALEIKGGSLAHTTLWGEVRWEHGEWGEGEGRVCGAGSWLESQPQTASGLLSCCLNHSCSTWTPSMCVVQGLSQQSWHCHDRDLQAVRNPRSLSTYAFLLFY